MRIAQVAPLHESVPPKLYGGTERVVSYLTEELVRQGHEVTLFASADSRTLARLVPCWPHALRLGEACPEPIVPHLIMLEQVEARAEQFDIIHFHTGFLHLPLARRLATPSLTTLHGRLDGSYLTSLFQEFSEAPMVAISESQRSFVPWAAWDSVIHHGLPEDLHVLGGGDGGYLAFAGRISREKRPDLAIEIARRAGLRLRIAAKIDDADRNYHDTVVRPLLRQPHVEYVGEIDESQKTAFFGDAAALLFPIDWPEPFGIVMIEAMACGTPTIAFRRGSVPEVIENGTSGFVVDGVDEAVAAVPLAMQLDRRACRAAFERRFTAARMARDYIAAYRRHVGQCPRRSPRWASSGRSA